LAGFEVKHIVEYEENKFAISANQTNQIIIYDRSSKKMTYVKNQTGDNHIMSIKLLDRDNKLVLVKD
jgi:hypothetical protein